MLNVTRNYWTVLHSTALSNIFTLFALYSHHHLESSILWIPVVTMDAEWFSLWFQYTFPSWLMKSWTSLLCACWPILYLALWVVCLRPFAIGFLFYHWLIIFSYILHINPSSGTCTFEYSLLIHSLSFYLLFVYFLLPLALNLEPHIYYVSSLLLSCCPSPVFRFYFFISTLQTLHSIVNTNSNRIYHFLRTDCGPATC